MSDPITEKQTDKETGDTPDSQVTQTTAEELVAPLADRMPPVTESAETVSSAPVEPAVVRPQDDGGTPFDPDRHAVDEFGNPRKNRSGRYYSKLLGKKGEGKGGAAGKKSETVRAQPTFNVDDGSPAPSGENGPVQDQYDAMAEVYLQSAYGPLIVGFTDEARPDEQEHAALKIALANYLRFKQATELSPGWGLSATIAAVLVRKSAKPKVKERIALLYIRVKDWFAKRKGTT